MGQNTIIIKRIKSRFELDLFIVVKTLFFYIIDIKPVKLVLFGKRKGSNSRTVRGQNQKSNHTRKIFQDLWFLSWLPWWRVAVSKESTEPRALSGLVEVITMKVLRSPPMTWLTVTDYLCHKRQQKCSVCRNHNPALSTIITFHRVCNKSNTTDPNF